MLSQETHASVARHLETCTVYLDGQSYSWLRRKTNNSHTGFTRSYNCCRSSNINRRDTGELRWRLNVISPSLFFGRRFTLAQEKEKLDLNSSEFCERYMGQQSARSIFFSKPFRCHVLRYRDAMKGCPCLRRSSGIYQRGLVFIQGSRYAERSEPLPDKACLVGVAGTATHLRAFLIRVSHCTLFVRLFFGELRWLLGRMLGARGTPACSAHPCGHACTP